LFVSSVKGDALFQVFNSPTRAALICKHSRGQQHLGDCFKERVSNVLQIDRYKIVFKHFQSDRPFWLSQTNIFEYSNSKSI